MKQQNMMTRKQENQVKTFIAKAMGCSPANVLLSQATTIDSLYDIQWWQLRAYLFDRMDGEVEVQVGLHEDRRKAALLVLN